MVGFVKIHRKISEWEWYTESHMVHLFLHLVIGAYWEDTTYKGIEYKRGQISIGRKKLSSDTGISEQRIRTGLRRLEKSNEILIKATNKFTIVTICNYDDYQSLSTQDQPTGNQQITNNQPTGNQQITTVKEVKKLKKLKKTNVVNGDCEYVFNFWNSKRIIIHKTIKQFESNIKSKLTDGYSKEELTDAIQNYSIILFQDKYYWTHKYGLKEFLTRAGNLDRFLSQNKPFDTFKNNDEKQSYKAPIYQDITLD